MKSGESRVGIELYFSDQAAIRRLRSSSIAPHLDSFAAELADARYARTTGQIELRLLDKLGGWLRRTRRTAVDLDPDTVGAFLSAYRRRRPLHRGYRRTIWRFLEHLQRQGVALVAPVAAQEESPLMKLERRYESHLRRERGLTAATGKVYGWWVHRFLEEGFGERTLVVTSLSPSEISSFVAKHAGSGGLRRAQLMVTALRSFFRFLVREGETRIDLSVSVPKVPCRSQGAALKHISDREVGQILATCDRATGAGRRNYAVLLLLARLGLRAGEVAGLELEDIDWRSGEISVLGKGLLRDRLPLVPELGEALVAYLRRDRPRSSSRRIFLSLTAPCRGLRGTAVTHIVERAIARAGLTPPFRGAHLLRHSLATNLLRKGRSLEEIGEVLRHRSTATTQIYAKVDLQALRAVAQPWPRMRGAR